MPEINCNLNLYNVYYEKHVRCYLQWAFPNLVSYNCFVELQQEVLEPLSIYLYTRFGICDGIKLIYKVRKNMKPQPLSDFDALLLKKRMLIESVIKEIKTQTQLQHTRHRSFINFQVNIVAALIAYTYLEKKPSLNLQACKRIPTAALSLEP